MAHSITHHNILTSVSSGIIAADLQYPIRLQDKLEQVEKEIVLDLYAHFKSTRKTAYNSGASPSSVMRKINR